MRPRPELTLRRIITAAAVALAADAIQIPANMGLLTGVGIPLAAGIDEIVDVIAAAAIIRSLGFHWVLLPSAVIEAIPGVDDVPSWTAAVAYLLSRRKREVLALIHPIAGSPRIALRNSTQQPPE